MVARQEKRHFMKASNHMNFGLIALSYSRLRALSGTEFITGTRREDKQRRACGNSFLHMHWGSLRGDKHPSGS